MAEDWETVILGDIAQVQTGIAKGKRGEANAVNLPYLRVANVQDGYFDLSEVKTIEVPSTHVERHRLRAGDVLFTEGGDLDKLGRGGVWHGQIDPCLHQNHVFAVRPNQDRLIPEFLAAVASSSYGRRYFLGCAKQTTNLASINSTQLRAFPIPLPPLIEQRKITAMANGVVNAIRLNQELVRISHSIKNAILNNCFSTSLLPEPSSRRWSTVSLGRVVSLHRTSVAIDPEQEYYELGIRSHGKGIFHKPPVLGSAIGNKRVFWVEPACLILNIVFAWEGAISQTSERERGTIASHRFPMFKPDLGVINLNFLRYYFQSKSGIRALASVSPGGAGRNKTLSQRDFLRLQVPVPPRCEQDRVAAALSSIDAQISESARVLEGLHSLKSGILQALLSRKLRVKLP